MVRKKRPWGQSGKGRRSRRSGQGCRKRVARMWSRRATGRMDGEKHRNFSTASLGAQFIPCKTRPLHSSLGAVRFTFELSCAHASPTPLFYCNSSPQHASCSRRSSARPIVCKLRARAKIPAHYRYAPVMAITRSAAAASSSLPVPAPPTLADSVGFCPRLLAAHYALSCHLARSKQNPEFVPAAMHFKVLPSADSA